MDEPESQGSRVTGQILEMIASGKLVAGQRLVEPDIARRLGVGTVPVREALRILAGDGVVTIVPHKGATLRLMTAKDIADTLKGIVGLLLVALGELGDPSHQELMRGLHEAEARIIASMQGRNCFDILNAAADYQLQFIRASGNDFVERSIRKVQFAYYNHQLSRFIDADDLAGLADNYRQLTRYAAMRDWRRVGRLFSRNATVICRKLNATGRPAPIGR